jgi:hypothetical protein
MANIEAMTSEMKSLLESGSVGNYRCGWWYIGVSEFAELVESLKM